MLAIGFYLHTRLIGLDVDQVSHRAIRPASRLLVIESVIPPGNEPFHGKFLDLHMLLIPGGKERTENEYRTLFERAGFELTRIVPTGAEVSIVEGKKR